MKLKYSNIKCIERSFDMYCVMKSLLYKLSFSKPACICKMNICYGTKSLIAQNNLYDFILLNPIAYVTLLF